MTAWIGARSLSHAAFEEHLVDPSTSNAAIEKLRAAALAFAETIVELTPKCADQTAAVRHVCAMR